jgi:hypothetical protein
MLLLVTLSACQDNSPDEQPDPDSIIDDIKDDTEEPKEDPMPTQCETNSDVIELSSTATLDAATLWRHSTGCEGLQFLNDTITFQDGITKATLTTGVFHLPAYRELVPSWNILIDDDVKVSIRVIPSNQDDAESLIMAYWTSDYKLSMANQSSELASVSIDTLVATTSLEYIRFQIEFEDGEFALKNVSYTTKQANDTFDLDETILEEVSISVPAKQQLSIPVIGNSICSPTSLAMVVSYYNELLDPSTSAGLVFDQGAQIYGNWSFNASVAGGYEGLYSRVEYIRDTATLLSYLQQGTPIILSIRTSSASDLTGSIMGYPAGHLIVLTGLMEQDGQWFALVNDPAEYTDENVPRQYPLDQLIDAWRGYTYIIQDTPFT